VRKSLATSKPRLTLAVMMSPEWLGASVRYNRWMNDKLYARAATLSDEARKRDCGAFFKSIHGTFNHLLATDRLWLARFNGVTLPDGLPAPAVHTDRTAGAAHRSRGTARGGTVRRGNLTVYAKYVSAQEAMPSADKR